MMKKMVFIALLAGCISSAGGVLTPMTRIEYVVAETESGRRQYTYTVANTGLWKDGEPAAITEFTIWFDDGLYRNLVVATPSPLSSQWDEIVWQPEPVLGDFGAYDVMTLPSHLGIGIGQSVYGFSVSFDWLGAGQPGAQFYEIINPATFETIAAGWTVPEPCTLLLLGVSGMMMRKR